MQQPTEVSFRVTSGRYFVRQGALPVSLAFTATNAKTRVRVPSVLKALILNGDEMTSVPRQSARKRQSKYGGSSEIRERASNNMIFR